MNQSGVFGSGDVQEIRIEVSSSEVNERMAALGNRISDLEDSVKKIEHLLVDTLGYLTNLRLELSSVKESIERKKG